jgi:hypothetical protein
MLIFQVTFKLLRKDFMQVSFAFKAIILPYFLLRKHFESILLFFKSNNNLQEIFSIIHFKVGCFLKFDTLFIYSKTEYRYSLLNQGEQQNLMDDDDEEEENKAVPSTVRYEDSEDEV